MLEAPGMAERGLTFRLIATAALAASDEIELKPTNEVWEWGSFIYVMPDGSVGYTGLFSNEAPGTINITVGDANAVPDGAVIVGFLHSHTRGSPGTDQRLASHDDWLIRDALLRHGFGRGVTVDPNMLLFIRTPGDLHPNDANKTFVYDTSDKNDNRPECKLEQD